MTPEEEKQLYQEKRKEFTSWLNVIIQNKLDSTSDGWNDYLVLRQWLKDNWKKEYLDLY